MAFGRAIGRRFLDAAKSYTGQIKAGTGDALKASRGSVSPRFLPDSGIRCIQWRPIFQAAVPPDRISMPIGVKLFDRIWAPNVDQLRGDIFASPPPLPPICVDEKDEKVGAMGMTVKDVRKVLKASQMELVRSRLRAIPKNFVSSSEFLRICCKVSNEEQGPELARSLDESAAVIVLGNVVFIRPEQELKLSAAALALFNNDETPPCLFPLLQVAKAIASAIPLSHSPPHDQRNYELQMLEEQKATIDKLAEMKTRRELWCGLAFLAAQTAGFMRLTFWELSWDVMEPICFYVTSLYFMAGYVFFMRTSTDPSFEGFFKSRFATKQKRLMEKQKFDLRRFNELKGVELEQVASSSSSSSSYADFNGRLFD